VEIYKSDNLLGKNSLRVSQNKIKCLQFIDLVMKQKLKIQFIRTKSSVNHIMTTMVVTVIIITFWSPIDGLAAEFVLEWVLVLHTRGSSTSLFSYFITFSFLLWFGE